MTRISPSSWRRMRNSRRLHAALARVAAQLLFLLSRLFRQQRVPPHVIGRNATFGFGAMPEMRNIAGPRR